MSGCSVRNPNVTCPNCAQFKQDKVFSDHQEKACRKDPATIPAIARGIRKAIIDCQTRFNESRWNCSTFYGEHLFGAFIDQSKLLLVLPDLQGHISWGWREGEDMKQTAIDCIFFIFHRLHKREGRCKCICHGWCYIWDCRFLP